MTAIALTHFQRPFDLPPATPQKVSQTGPQTGLPARAGAPDHFSMSRDAAFVLLLNLLLADSDAAAPRNPGPLAIDTILLVDHAGRLQGAIVLLFPTARAEAQRDRRDEQQGERVRHPHRGAGHTHGAPPQRPAAQANPHAPQGWAFDKLPHEILGLDANETDVGKIDKAFRERARSAHPDKGGHQEAMQALVAARDFIKGRALGAAGGSAAN